MITTVIYTLSLHDALPIYRELKTTKSTAEKRKLVSSFERAFEMLGHPMMREFYGKSEDMYMFSKEIRHVMHRDRKSTRLNSSHVAISYAVFCLKKKKKMRE